VNVDRTSRAAANVLLVTCGALACGCGPLQRQRLPEEILRASRDERERDARRASVDVPSGTAPSSILGAVVAGKFRGKELPDVGFVVESMPPEPMPEVPARPAVRTIEEAKALTLRDLDSPSAHWRYVAAAEAGMLRLAEAVPGLVELLDPKDPASIPAIVSLGVIGGDASARALSKAYGRFTEARIQLLIVRSLGRTRSRAALRALLAAFGDGRVSYRASAAYALGALRCREAIPHLRQELSQKGQPAVIRVAAASALVALGNRDGLDELRDAVARGSPDLQRVAIDALANFVAGEAPLGDPAVDAMRAAAIRSIASALGSPYAQAWRASLRALASMRALDAIPIIDALAEGSAQVEPRARLARAGIRGGEALAEIEAALLNADPQMRAAACEVAALRGDRDAVRSVARALSDRRFFVRATAARALGALGGPEAATALHRAAMNEDKSLRSAAKAALGVMRARGEETPSDKAAPGKKELHSEEAGFTLERVIRQRDGSSYCILRTPDERVRMLKQGEIAADGFEVKAIVARPDGGGRVILLRDETGITLDVGPDEEDRN
jgi:HEAT repeat protein